jgi:hypothetical protein
LEPRRHALDDNVTPMPSSLASLAPWSPARGVQGRPWRFVFFCVALTACGGIIDTDDGGTTGVDGGDKNDGGVVKKDASKSDVGVSPSCTPIQTAVGLYDGGCQASASWSCGDTKYTAQCNCPSGQCSCSQETSQGGVGHTEQEPSFCPSCDPLAMPKLCGFPTN